MFTFFILFWHQLQKPHVCGLQNCQIVILSILENERKGQNLQLNLKMSIGHIIIVYFPNLQTFRISYFQALRRALRSEIPWNASKKIELG